MKPVERVKAALKFTGPDKIPVFNLASGDIFPIPITYSKNWHPGWNENEIGLFPHVRGTFNWNRPEWAKNNPDYEGNKWRTIPHEEIDEWGCIWNMKGNDTDMGHPGRPTLLNWKDYDDYISKYTPNAEDKSRYEFAIDLTKRYENDSYFMLLLPTFGPSQVIAAMRGFSTYLVDHRQHPKELVKALELVADYHVDVLKYALNNGIKAHGVWVVDDLGEQNNPFFRPETFRKLYESSYKRIIDGTHTLGLEVHLHCCGKIDPLLPILIDWGLDAIELDSPRMSGYPNLRKYSGQIMFWGCVNIQSIYPNSYPEEVEREVWHMVRNLGTKNGGFGAYLYPTPRDIQVTRKNIKAFERGVKKYGDYSKIPPHWWDSPLPEEWKVDEVPPLPID